MRTKRKVSSNESPFVNDGFAFLGEPIDYLGFQFGTFSFGF